MDIGVFIPIGNNGWLISKSSPQYLPSFELNKAIVQKAEEHGLDFALSMIKLKGFGGETEFWDHNLESFTLMAGLAAVTERIKLYASTPILALPPAIVARMATTIDSIAPAASASTSSPAGHPASTPRWTCGPATNTSATATPAPPSTSP
jgi:pyrimidine oxygenase